MRLLWGVALLEEIKDSGEFTENSLSVKWPCAIMPRSEDEKK